MVNVVLLFAINRRDRELFHEIFDNLIVLLFGIPEPGKGAWQQ